MKTVLGVLIALAFISAVVLAADLPSPPDSGYTEIAVALRDLIWAINQLPGLIVNAFFAFLVAGLMASTQQLVDASFHFLFSAPDPSLFCTPYNAVLSILESVYSVLLMGLALYFIARATDVSGRVAAKRWLERMIVMIVVLSFAYPFFETMLDFNTYLATNLASSSMAVLFRSPGSFASAILALVLLFPLISMLMLTFMTLVARYLLIPFAFLFFPIAIFLYFIPATESWGRTFLKIIFSLVFMTAFDSLVLLGLSALANAHDPNLAYAFTSSFIMLLGFGAIGVLNLALFVMAIFSVVSQSKTVLTVIGIGVISKVAAAIL